MYQKTQGVKTSKPFLFSTKGIIQEPQLGILTEPYTIGEKDYYILKQKHWVDWIYLIACASLGIFLEKLFELFALVYQICKLSPEDAGKLTASHRDKIDSTIIILIISGLVSVVLWAINKFVPTKKKKLLEDIRNVLDRDRSIIASKSKGKNQ